jgi:hypothetical protein
MRRMLWFAAAAMLAFPGVARPQSNASQPPTPSQNSAQTSQPAPQPVQGDSLAEAARKAREQKKEAPKPAKVFTNDNLPVEGGISTVGASSSASSASAEGAAEAGAKAPADEKAWREKFAKLHHKLDQDQAELDVLQREASVDELQYYNGDPTKAYQDQTNSEPLGAAYNKKVADIDAKKQQVEADKQAISDAEDQLHKAGGDPGWAR